MKLFNFIVSVEEINKIILRLVVLIFIAPFSEMSGKVNGVD